MVQITEEQITVYVKFRGNSDAIEQVGTQSEKQSVSQATWTELMEFRQRISLERKGLLSHAAQEDLESDLRRRFCADVAIVHFKRFVEQVTHVEDTEAN